MVDLFARERKQERNSPRTITLKQIEALIAENAELRARNEYLAERLENAERTIQCQNAGGM